MYCTQCATQLAEGASFCHACGTSVYRPTSPTAERTNEPGSVREPNGPTVGNLVQPKPESPLRCPACGVYSPPGTSTCDCGYDFHHGVRHKTASNVGQGVQPTPSTELCEALLPFFPVATHKFITLSICSFGIYELYWCYQNWKRIKTATGEDLSPFWRAFFAPLWGFSLFRRVRERAVFESVPVVWNSGVLGTLYLVLSVSWRLPDPWWWISLATFVAMLPVQQVAQRVNGLHGSSEDRNENYSTANVVLIVVGGLLLVLGIVGTFLPK